MSAPILLLCRDLLFTSKITATAQVGGVTVRVIREPSKLIDEVGDSMIVDLNQSGYLEAAAGWKVKDQSRRVVGFVSHVDTDAIAAARAAGLDQVVTRGGFVGRLPQILKDLAQ